MVYEITYFYAKIEKQFKLNFSTYTLWYGFFKEPPVIPKNNANNIWQLGGEHLLKTPSQQLITYQSVQLDFQDLY